MSGSAKVQSSGHVGTHHSAELLAQSDDKTLIHKGSDVVLLVILSLHLPPTHKASTGPGTTGRFLLYSEPPSGKGP